MTIATRLATGQDAVPIWEWRNDPVTRQNSLGTDGVQWEEHQSWLKRQLTDPAVRLYMLDDQEHGPVAQVRYVRHDESCAEVHITVAPAVRGRGVGTRALRLTLPLAMWSLQVSRVTALIKADNKASLRAFGGAGFVVEQEREFRGSRCVVLSLDARRMVWP